MAQKKVVTTYKGFDKNLSCRGFRFEIGKTYKHEGAIKRCESGFHSCENPIDVFSYYEPGKSRYAVVEASGLIDREENGDTKLASAELHIKSEIQIPEIVTAAIKWIVDRCDPVKTKHSTGYRSASSSTGDQSASSSTGDQSASSSTGDHSASSSTGDHSASSSTGYQSASSSTGYRSASSSTGDHSASSSTGYRSASSSTGDQSASSSTGYQSASSSTGYRSASSSTGYQSASSSTGYRSASSSTGYQSASSSTGDQSASSSTGYRSASSSTGKNAVAMNIGIKGKAMAGKYGAIVLCNHDDNYNIRHIRASKVGENGIKPDTWYVLNDAGEFVEA